MASQRDPQALLRQANELTSGGAGRSSSSGGGLVGAATSWFMKKINSPDAVTDRYNDASELYRDAAIAFTNQRQDLEAARAYELAGDAALRAQLAHMASTYLQDASERYKKIREIDEALRCLKKAIDISATVQGNFNMAAKQQGKLADLYEKENAAVEFADARKPEPNKRPLPYDLRLLIEANLMAAEYHERARNSMTKIPFSVKAAENMALIGDLDRAALTMDEAIDDASTSAHHPQLETFMTKGALIHLVKNDDKVAFTNTMDRYCQMSRNFSTLPRFQMVLRLEQLFDEGDQKKWKEARKSYMERSITDSWMDKFLENTEKTLEQRQDDFS